MSNYETLEQAWIRGASVAFSYQAVDGSVRVRRGTVEKLTDTYVVINDTNRGFRTCNLSGIVSPITVDTVIWTFLPDDTNAVNYWYHELKGRI